MCLWLRADTWWRIKRVGVISLQKPPQGTKPSHLQHPHSGAVLAELVCPLPPRSTSQTHMHKPRLLCWGHLARSLRGSAGASSILPWLPGSPFQWVSGALQKSHLPPCCFPRPFHHPPHPSPGLDRCPGMEPGPGLAQPRVVPAGAHSWQAPHSWCLPVGRDSGFCWSCCSARILRLAQKSLFSLQAEVQSFHTALCWEMKVRERRKW